MKILKLMRTQKSGAICEISEREAFIEDDQFKNILVLTWNYTEITPDGRVIYRSCHKLIQECKCSLQHKEFVNLLREAKNDMK